MYNNALNPGLNNVGGIGGSATLPSFQVFVGP